MLVYQYPMEDPTVVSIAEKQNTSSSTTTIFGPVWGGCHSKCSNPKRIQENINIFDFELSKNEYDQLKALDKGEAGRQFGGDWMSGHPECPHPPKSS